MIPLGLTIAIPVTHLIGIIGWLILGGTCHVLIAILFLLDKSFVNYSIRNRGILKE